MPIVPGGGRSMLPSASFVPSSALMLAFWAFADPGANETPTPEAGELEEAHWFDRAELGTKLAEGSIGLPPPGTIGNYLISTWLSGG